MFKRSNSRALRAREPATTVSMGPPILGSRRRTRRRGNVPDRVAGLLHVVVHSRGHGRRLDTLGRRFDSVGRRLDSVRGLGGSTTTVGDSTDSTGGGVSIGTGTSGWGSRAPASSRAIIPDRLTVISLIRLRRVMSRGEPGVRLNPRDFRALASVSMVTVRVGER